MDPSPHIPVLDPDRADPWDGFLIGPENALAQASARELSRGTPGLSPLVLVGPAGSGKSRILECLAADLIARRPGASIALIPGERFVTECHQAADEDDPGAWADLRRRFRDIDLLALDDLHPLSKSPISLAELAPTLDALDASGALVAVTVRDDPGRWEGWPPRLADRLRSGLTARLEPPGSPTRRRFLLDRALARGLTVTPEAIDLLAEAPNGYRTLEGWINRLTLASRLHRRPIDSKLVAEMLADDVPTGPVASVSEIIRSVASRFGLRVRDLKSSSRRAALVEPRHLAILLARELTGSSFASIGNSFGGRDPKTVRHACKAASRRLAHDPALAAVAETIRRRWSGNQHGAPGI